jgi:dihydrofolate reductase
MQQQSFAGVFNKVQNVIKNRAAFAVIGSGTTAASCVKQNPVRRLILTMFRRTFILNQREVVPVHDQDQS